MSKRFSPLFHTLINRKNFPGFRKFPDAPKVDANFASNKVSEQTPPNETTPKYNFGKKSKF